MVIVATTSPLVVDDLVGDHDFLLLGDFVDCYCCFVDCCCFSSRLRIRLGGGSLDGGLEVIVVFLDRLSMTIWLR